MEPHSFSRLLSALCKALFPPQILSAGLGNWFSTRIKYKIISKAPAVTNSEHFHKSSLTTYTTIMILNLICCPSFSSNYLKEQEDINANFLHWGCDHGMRMHLLTSPHFLTLSNTTVVIWILPKPSLPIPFSPWCLLTFFHQSRTLQKTNLFGGSGRRELTRTTGRCFSFQWHENPCRKTDTDFRQ